MPSRRSIPPLVALFSALVPLVGCGAASAERESAAVDRFEKPSGSGRDAGAVSDVGGPTPELAQAALPASELSVLDRPLEAVGSANGLETTRVQLRLIEIGFWIDGYDGRFSHTTRQAVMAFQKYSGLQTSGAVDEATARALTNATSRVMGLATLPGVVVEVDKDRQLLFLTVDGRTQWALNASTGSGQYYEEPNQKYPGRMERGRSLTPSGFFFVDRQRPEGWWSGDLGEIYRPKYFNGGIAIHGSKVIPDYPASHGCVRVSTAAMDMIWESGLVPRKTLIWVYGQDIAAEEPASPAESPAV